MSQEVMREERGQSESGFALIVAILALLLLTFLGLTLAATTSTELQVATNYRWSRQAFYNAEAGIEAGKDILRYIPNNWNSVLPAPRAAWLIQPPGTIPQVGIPAPVAAAANADAWGNPTRNFEAAPCDTRNGSGFGAVLDDTTAGGLIGGAAANGPYQNVTTYQGQTLNGAFTIWIRRVTAPTGISNQYRDDVSPTPSQLIMTAEGVAPYTGGGNQAFQLSNRAVVRLELTLNRVAQQGCSPTGRGQVGAGPQGSNFAACAQLTGGAAGSLGNAFGGAGSGNLADTGAQ